MIIILKQRPISSDKIFIMDLEDLLVSQAAEEWETGALEELDEIILFDLKEATAAEEEEESEFLLREREVPEEIAISPPGVVFFKKDMYSLYTEDTLVWPVKDLFLDPFLSRIDPSIVNECIKNKYFLREGNSSCVPIKYLLHTICCTYDENLRHASYNSLAYILTTCTSLNYIKDELCLALVNLGADMSILQRNVLNYRSCVVPPPSSSDLEDVQITDTQLREVLAIVLRFLSQCFKKYKKYTSHDVDELILIFIAVALDPKVIDAVLDTHIATCIAHSLNLYSTDEEFSERLRSIVERVLEYCSADLPSVVHLCQACITPTHRGKTLRSALAFQQLRVHLKVPEENFVGDVQVKDIADLLTRYFETRAELSVSYDAFYIIRLIDLCLHLDLVPPDQMRSDLSIICELMEQKFRRSLGSADDMNPTISFQYLAATLSKWKRYLT